jgi:signal transduction histidine kinase/DNA-binding response OmpR family regulator
MRNFIFILCLAIHVCHLCAQNRETDSLRQIFALETDALKKAEAYYNYAEKMMKVDPAMGDALADTLELLGKKAKHQKSVARSLHLRGDALYEQGKYEASLPFYRRELAMALDLKDLSLQGRALNRIGGLKQNTGEYDSSLIYLTQAAKIKEQIGDKLEVAIIYSNIGNVFSDMKLPDKAIEWLEKSLAIRLSLPDSERGAIIAYNNISIAYNGKQDYNKAIEYAQRGYDLAVQTGNKFLAGVLAGSLGHLWMEKKELDKSIEMSEKAAVLLTEANRKPNLVFPLVNLADAWFQKGDNAKALEYNDRGYAIMEELKLIEPLEVYYENYANIYESQGNHKQALFWFKKFMALDDSLFNKEKLNAVAEAEARFQNEKKEAQLARQQLELERQSSQKRTILIGAVAALLALGGGFQYFRSKQKIRQKEAELTAQLRQAETEKLREMDAMKTAFFANVSHEFRTPLTLIISPLRKLLDNPAEKPNPSLYRTMLLSGERLLELVNQLLDLTKAEAGRLELQAAEADVLPLLRGVAGSFTSLADVRQIRFETAMPQGEIPASFDKDKLSKIVANLLSNSFKFTPEAGTVRLEVNTDKENLLLTVSDTGIGIEPSELPHVFERFYRAKEAMRAEVAGSGIGLALTKELVELHGGSIGVESPVARTGGTGTVFSVRLPILKKALEPVTLKEELLTGATFPDTVPAGAEAPPLFPTNKTTQVLIVEDNPDVRLFVKDCLDNDYHILLAPDGQAGLETARKSIPDLIISDVMMPHMDGFELCRELKTDDRTSHIPVVMLTARAEQVDKMAGLTTGADDYLIKPFDARELLARVANLISQRKKLQEHYRRSLTFAASNPVEADSVDAVFLKKVREAVETNLEDENFSVVELGLQVGMSRSQLHRKLSALTGFSPNEIIRNMRLERAKELLEKKAGNASEIAYMTGFNSPAYFAKCFKDYFGVTPSEV